MSGDPQNPIVISTTDSNPLSILVKGLVYVVLPIALVAGIGFWIYTSLVQKQVDLHLDKGRNDSEKYQDDQVKIQIEVQKLKVDVKESQDRKNFEDVRLMVLQKFGEVK